MFAILVYDFNEKRVGKALKKCRKYLNWVQNSVFEGEITRGNLTKLKMELQSIMKKDEDSIIIYTMENTKYSEREIIGLEKNEISQIIWSVDHKCGKIYRSTTEFENKIFKALQGIRNNKETRWQFI